MAGDRHFEMEKVPYLSIGLTDRHEILHVDASRTSKPHRPLKI